MFPPPSKRRHYRERTIETPSRTSEVNREVEERNRQRAEEKRRDASGIKLLSHSFVLSALMTIRNHSHHHEESADSHRHSSSHHRSSSRESSRSRRTERRDREWEELTKDRTNDDEWEEATPLQSIRPFFSRFSFSRKHSAPHTVAIIDAVPRGLFAESDSPARKQVTHSERSCVHSLFSIRARSRKRRRSGMEVIMGSICWRKTTISLAVFWTPATAGRTTPSTQPRRARWRRTPTRSFRGAARRSAARRTSIVAQWASASVPAYQRARALCSSTRRSGSATACRRRACWCRKAKW